jgi:hypothetical protein
LILLAKEIIVCAGECRIYFGAPTVSCSVHCFSKNFV